MESKLTKYSMTEMNMQTITSAVTKKKKKNLPDTLCIMHVFTKMFCKVLHQGYLSYIYTLLFTACFKETKQKYN